MATPACPEKPGWCTLCQMGSCLHCQCPEGGAGRRPFQCLTFSDRGFNVKVDRMKQWLLTYPLPVSAVSHLWIILFHSDLKKQTKATLGSCN